MNKNYNTSRRKFLKSGALATTVIMSRALSSGCLEKPAKNNVCDYPVFAGMKWNTETGIAGLLFSQVGYETGYPVRIIIRLPDKIMLPDDTLCYLIPVTGNQEYKTQFSYWGEIWGSHWWVAEFRDISQPGKWDIEVRTGNTTLFVDTCLEVKKNILWDKTVEWSSVDMLERRTHFTKVGAGWQDAGTLWVESPAQSAAVIMLTDLLDKQKERFGKDFF